MKYLKQMFVISDHRMATKETPHATSMTQNERLGITGKYLENKSDSLPCTCELPSVETIRPHEPDSFCLIHVVMSFHFRRCTTHSPC